MDFFTSDYWDETLWLKVKEIYQEAFGGHGGKPEKIIRNMFAKRICFLHMALEGNDVAGMALTGSLGGSGIIMIDYLTVRKELRGCGIGQEFFKYIKSWAAEQEWYKRILIEVECENTAENLARIHFWGKCGFVLADEYTHHYNWVPEPYQAMVLYLRNDSKVPLNGEDLFKYITAFHKESFRK